MKKGFLKLILWLLVKLETCSLKEMLVIKNSSSFGHAQVVQAVLKLFQFY